MGFWEYLSYERIDLANAALQHLLVVVIALAVATVVGVGVAVLTWDNPRWSALALATSGTLLTIPSLALLALLIPLVGLGWTPTIIALVLYSLLPIVRNAIAGLRGIDDAVREAATGMGLSRAAAMRGILLPMAWPVIAAGIRVSAQMLFAVATIAAYVAGPGLGNDILTGLSRLGAANALNKACAGTLGVVVLALSFDAAFVLIHRLITPRGLRV
ncbi:ABC transporter permease [Streptomyces sp. NPDC051218]|uniref:ABC transporter permease n=1 Tax=Streptomyces sp. NPDC051218 TaxID=3365645 RepID=UPI0037B8D598